MHHLMGLVPPDQSALSLGRPLCVRRGTQDCKGATPPHRWPIDLKLSAPDLGDSVLAHGTLSDCSAPTRAD